MNEKIMPAVIIKDGDPRLKTHRESLFSLDEGSVLSETVKNGAVRQKTGSDGNPYCQLYCNGWGWVVRQFDGKRQLSTDTGSWVKCGANRYWVDDS